MVNLEGDWLQHYTVHPKYPHNNCSAAEWRFTLLDTLGKRIDFINGAVKNIGLKNVEGLWARAEDAGKNANGLNQREVSPNQYPHRKAPSKSSANNWGADNCALQWRKSGVRVK
eukprot:1175512-Prorocentrum_minimum.AAC.4